MDKNIIFTEKTDMTYGRGYVYSLQYHIVWCTKYRKQVLKGGIDRRMKELLADIASEYNFKIMAMEVMPDLKKSPWGGHLWNPSYCALSVSDRSFEQVKRYIEGQKTK